MKKRNILKENRDFNRIIKSVKPLNAGDYLIYVEKNQSNIYHFGFSVGKKIGNAVTRNKIKRQLKNILDEKNYKNGFNCIIIVKKGILDKSFQQRKDDLLKAIKKLDIVKG